MAEDKGVEYHEAWTARDRAMHGTSWSQKELCRTEHGARGKLWSSKEDMSASSPQALHHGRDRQDVRNILCAISNCLWTVWTKCMSTLYGLHHKVVQQSSPHSKRNTREQGTPHCVCRPSTGEFAPLAGVVVLNQRTTTQ